MKNPHNKHRDRIRAEFRASGMDHFPDHKVLELMLYYTRPRGDTNAIAHSLMDRFGSLSGVFDAPYELLLQVEGVGETTATFLKAEAALVKRYMIDAYSTKNAIKTTGDAKAYMEYRFVGDTVERILLACLGPGDRIIYSDIIATGTLEQVDLSPAQVVKTCLRVDAAKAVLAHNHPGGFCNPSSKDVRTTSILFEELYRVDVELYDHIIVASDGVYSMREGGMLPESSGPVLLIDKR